jgi:hypothetical protein
VGNRRGQVDVAHPLATNGRAGDLNTASLAGDATETDVLVLATGTLPVSLRPKDGLAEKAIAFGSKASIVDGFWLGDFAIGPREYFLW